MFPIPRVVFQRLREHRQLDRVHEHPVGLLVSDCQANLREAPELEACPSKQMHLQRICHHLRCIIWREDQPSRLPRGSYSGYGGLRVDDDQKVVDTSPP